MTAQHIVMNFVTPPTIEDLRIIVSEVIKVLPEELIEHTDKLDIEIDDFPDEATEQELDISDSFDVLVFYRSGKELYPGVERKHSKDSSTLFIYRRPILDMWCETCDDLFTLIRQAIIEEIARSFDFSDHDIADMVERHYQGLL